MSSVAALPIVQPDWEMIVQRSAELGALLLCCWRFTPRAIHKISATRYQRTASRRSIRSPCACTKTYIDSCRTQQRPAKR